MKLTRLEALTYLLREAPSQFQGIKFDEDAEKAAEFAAWLVQNHGVLVLSSMSAEDWTAWYRKAFPSRARDMKPESLEATGALIRGALLILARGEG